MTDRSSADVLRGVSEPAWPQIQALIEGAPSPVRVLPSDLSRRDVALESLQVSTGSFLGALVGGMRRAARRPRLVAHPWRRCPRPAGRSRGQCARWGCTTAPRGRVGRAGRSVRGQRRRLDAPPGAVCYWGPDTLDWTPIGGGHSAFVTWALSNSVADFYSSLRWPGWEGEIDALAPDQGLSLGPPPFTAEGRDPAQVSHRAVPITELHGAYADLAQQLSETPPDGSALTVKVAE